LLVITRLIVTDHKREINVANVVLVAYKCFISRLETVTNVAIATVIKMN